MLRYLIALQLQAYAARRGVDSVIVCDVCHVAIPHPAGLSWLPVRSVPDLQAIVGGVE